MSEFTLYLQQNGFIEAILDGSPPINDEVPVGCSWVEGRGDAATEFVENGTITPRPVMGLTVSGAEFNTLGMLTVSGIPTGTVLKHPAGETVIDDGYFEWDTVTPGEYTFKLTNFPYQEEVIHATVSDA